MSERMLRRSRALLLGVCGASLSTIGNAAETQHLYDYQWRLPGSSNQVSGLEETEQRLRETDVVFFGELHNHPGAHLAQMELFEEIRTVIICFINNWLLFNLPALCLSRFVIC